MKLWGLVKEEENSSDFGYIFIWIWLKDGEKLSMQTHLDEKYCFYSNVIVMVLYKLVMKLH